MGTTRRMRLIGRLVVCLCVAMVFSSFGQPAGKGKVVGYVDESAEGKRSLGASGHCVEFTRPPDVRFIEGVSIFAGRYGEARAPLENFHIYVLNEQQQMLADVPVPYRKVQRAALRWYTFATPSIEVPEKFYVALNFNPRQTKGIYLGYDSSVAESHSYTGLPRSGFSALKDKYDWMVRLTMVAEPSGGKEVKRLEEFKAPVYKDPFADCIELKHDDGKSDGMQSYGGSGPAISFTLSEFVPGAEKGEKPVKVKGLRIYGSRYGSGYDTEKTMIKVYLVDEGGKAYATVEVPYGLFSYKAEWVEIVFPQPQEGKTTKDGVLNVAIDPEAHQRKGIYSHYNGNPPQSHSMVGNVEKGFEPIAGREWMIRAYVEKP